MFVLNWSIIELTFIAYIRVLDKYEELTGSCEQAKTSGIGGFLTEKLQYVSNDGR